MFIRNKHQEALGNIGYDELHSSEVRDKYRLVQQELIDLRKRVRKAKAE